MCWFCFFASFAAKIENTRKRKWKRGIEEKGEMKEKRKRVKDRETNAENELLRTRDENNYD